MTKNTEEETKQNSSNITTKIRKASFIPLEGLNNENFKYQPIQRLIQIYGKTFNECKRFVNSLLQRPRLWASKIEWKNVKEDTIEWIVEVILEGLSANFATHFLFGVEFTPFTVIAHGIVIKQGLSIVWRLKYHGSTSKIFKKDERESG